LKLQKPVLSSTSKEEKDSEQENSKKQRWSKKRSLLYLLLAVAGIAIVIGIMVDSVEAVAQKLGLTELYIGAVTVGDSRYSGKRRRTFKCNRFHTKGKNESSSKYRNRFANLTCLVCSATFSYNWDYIGSSLYSRFYFI
jgi:hypothetical protein